MFHCSNSVAHLFLSVCMMVAAFTTTWSFLAFLALDSAISRAAVLATSYTPLYGRDDLNLTSSANTTTIIQSLVYVSNCTLSIAWYKHLPLTGAGAGSDRINIEFLRSALPPEYQNSSDAAITNFYNTISSEPLIQISWIGTAKDTIETACITPQISRNITIADLDSTQNCTATALFLSSLGWITGVQTYTPSSSNDTSWLEFLRSALPSHQNNLTDLELLVYRNYFLESENTTAISSFLQTSFAACKTTICSVQGYTGNPDIGGIGVICSYTVEAVLVTLYFVAINLQLFLKHKGPNYRYRMPRRIENALAKASDELADGALFFSLSISTAGWVSFVSGTSYYEKLVFTSANVLALSALFAFLGMFTVEGRKKRGEYILALMIAGILTESGIQYIVYLTEPNEKYADFACLDGQFQVDGYHPSIFEALFFLLLGLSVMAGIVGIFWLRKRAKEERKPEHKDTASVVGQTVLIDTVDRWVTATRIVIQVVAMAVMWVELVYLWKIRGVMEGIAGDTWSEGTWGFGQILTLFIWLPPIIDILGWLLLPTWMLGEDVDSKKNDAAQTEDVKSEKTVVNEKALGTAVVVNASEVPK